MQNHMSVEMYYSTRRAVATVNDRSPEIVTMTLISTGSRGNLSGLSCREENGFGPDCVFSLTDYSVSCVGRC